MIEKQALLVAIYTHEEEKVSIFDILYELSMPYEELKPILDECVADKTLTTEDGKYYTLTSEDAVFSEETGKEKKDVSADEEIADFFGLLQQSGTRPKDDLSALILSSLGNGFRVEKEYGRYYISVCGLSKTDVTFELSAYDDGSVFLSERGAIMSRLEDSLGSSKAYQKTQEIAGESGMKIIGKAICVQVFSAEQTLSCLLRLYAVMERLLHTKDSWFL